MEPLEQGGEERTYAHPTIAHKLDRKICPQKQDKMSVLCLRLPSVFYERSLEQAAQQKELSVWPVHTERGGGRRGDLKSHSFILPGLSATDGGRKHSMWSEGRGETQTQVACHVQPPLLSQLYIQ